MPIATIQPRDLHALSGPIHLIDVRSPGEFASGHVAGARNLPLDRLDAAALLAEKRSGPLYVICQGGVRSRKACEQLATAGLSDLVDVAGGTTAWKAAGLPVEGTGAAIFGVERQVRCIIGGGVLAGVVLAFTVHPYWAALSGFFGAGLLMAGLTNICPLALAVAAMPWNRSAPAEGSCCSPAGK
jgi:rhodanese-related sulfurtransferase